MTSGGFPDNAALDQDDRSLHVTHRSHSQARINPQENDPIPVGKSLLPIFKGKKRKPQDVLYWQFGKAKAVRKGDFKLVKFGNADWELYDLAEDRTELKSTTTKHPDKVRTMTGLWEECWVTSRSRI